MSLWGIILVVLGHSGFEEASVMGNLKALHTYIYSYHMPLFFFISGYLYALTNSNFPQIPFQRFMKKKFLRLYIPYIILGTIIFLIKYTFSGLSHTERFFSINDFLLMFIAPHWNNSTMGYLWYIVTLFFLFLIISFLSKCGINLRNASVSVIIIILLWGIKYNLPSRDLFKICNVASLVWYIPFFVIGIQYHKYKSSFKLENSGIKAAILFTISIAWLFMPHSSCFLNYIVKIASAITGIAFSVCFCKTLLSFKCVCDKILPLGDMTYTIYLMSFFGQYATKIFVVNMLHLHWGICVISMFCAGMIFPVFIYKFCKQNSVLQNNKLVRLIIGV